MLVWKVACWTFLIVAALAVGFQWTPQYQPGVKAWKTMSTNSAPQATEPMGALSGNLEAQHSLTVFPPCRHNADTPLRLGNWLLSNLDIHSMTLKLSNGAAIDVDEEAVLGLPREPKVITDRARHEKSVILNIWRASFEKVFRLFDTTSLEFHFVLPGWSNKIGILSTTSLMIFQLY
nr:uncharacterized protein LOC109189836 [Ipomoea batatas]